MDREIGDVISDLYQFNCIVLSGIVGGLGMDKDDMAVKLQSMAGDAEKMRPDSQVSAMLQDFAELRAARNFRGTDRSRRRARQSVDRRIIVLVLAKATRRCL
jgi:hypothetical protein